MKRAFLFLLCVAAGPDEEACRQGVAEGCVNLGMDYETGSGRPKDAVKALELYRVGCDAGIGAGCVNAGVLLAHGTDMKQDLAASIPLFRKGCDLGVAEGCHDLGTMMLYGLGMTPDPQPGLDLLGKACDLGHAGACARAAELWKRGVQTPTVVVKRDRKKAKAMKKRACELDSTRCGGEAGPKGP